MWRTYWKGKLGLHREDAGSSGRGEGDKEGGGGGRTSSSKYWQHVFQKSDKRDPFYNNSRGWRWTKRDVRISNFVLIYLGQGSHFCLYYSCDKAMVIESWKVLCLIVTKMNVFILHYVIFLVEWKVSAPTSLPKYQSVRFFSLPPPLKIRSDFKTARPLKFTKRNLTPLPQPLVTISSSAFISYTLKGRHFKGSQTMRQIFAPWSGECYVAFESSLFSVFPFLSLSF